MTLPAQTGVTSERDEQVALANRLMTGHPVGSTDHECGLELLQTVAETESGMQARWLLGAYFLQVSSRPNAHVQALRWLGRAADEGTPPAVDRLADLYLSGLGCERSVKTSVGLQLRLAEQGFRQAAWEAAYLLATAGPVDGLEAATAFLRACALGYPAAYYSLGIRFATGDGVARDIGFARALLRRAADGGYVGAAECAEGLPEALEDECRWYERLKANLHAVHPLLAGLVPGRPDGRQSPHPLVLQLERHLVSIGHPALRLDPTGRAATVPDDGRDDSIAGRSAGRTWSWLSQCPRIATYRGFATPEECTYLINKVAAMVRPAADYRRGNSQNENAELESFSGRGYPIGALYADSVTRMLEHRISMKCEWPTAKLEPSSIICYRPGEEYKPHTDFFSEEQMLANEHKRRDFGGQRMATVLLYLRAPGAGGETSYLAANLDVAGEDGMAVIHYNVDGDCQPDPASVHAGRAITAGEKWLWRSTLRENSLYVSHHACD